MGTLLFLFQVFDYLVVFPGPDPEVYLREFAGKLLLIPLGKASGNNKQFAAPCFFKAGQLNDLVNGLPLGILDESAGIDDNYIGLFFFRSNPVVMLCRYPEHYL